jgi:hypothetical protein
VSSSMQALCKLLLSARSLVQQGQRALVSAARAAVSAESLLQYTPARFAEGLRSLLQYTAANIFTLPSLRLIILHKATQHTTR